MLSTIFKLFFSIAIIFLFLWTGISIQALSGISFPGSIIGMLLLFFCLSVGIVPVQFLQGGAKLMLKHMLLFFIPISVGLMNYFDVLYQQMGLFLACTLGANILVAILLSYLFRMLNSGEKE
ncbi:CidA/LrgA family protein [Aliiglaciecola sp. 3_MG-2023]|uniref:CidA/LrgA family protein n=1 Tax=Aliiglaciecola sp. 3_MG-2023 TaxID=3062644 RepID=UPI0026E2D619|nr:CidA/LrgA family protein [Aliiglaciecola sp. 3_MG-2023]MDO6694706.1 CidA/LrgA family protein [Aliiglaciecola sp. 3_MG-2023]